MQRELLENLYRTDQLDDLLKESEYTVRRRKECQQMVESLSKANEIVNQVQQKSIDNLSCYKATLGTGYISEHPVI